MRILLTGGSACGKSTFAEALAMQLGSPRYYLATMRPYGEESLLKIAEHRKARRQKNFETIEQEVDIGKAEFPSNAIVLLECLCNLVANELFDEDGAVDEGAYQRVYDSVVSLEDRAAHYLVVTNDVGSGTAASYDNTTHRYVELLGRLNAELASRFEVVCELVAGIPVVLKDESQADTSSFEQLLAQIHTKGESPFVPKSSKSSQPQDCNRCSDRSVKGDDGTMMLVIGGGGAGKLTYVRSLGYSDEQLANALLDERPVIYNLQDLVAASVAEAPALLEALLAKEVVVCDEVGSGVIPGVQVEREAREATGRLCSQLAQQAHTVVRLIAGIPIRIK
ncbi:MAG: bifunctional adenosylcobinamide kinase/adenosylcobinamide-phosphate guanylyltransferase [Coriobacteriales bacterium]|jgi:adenosylcobinamide kinase/adenosylcobinamide-phosphate guanylyltransferase|nr:bifunctional adenosylcobinamide kinase/adenosylcobinamide-phosphate guanylyltransferase [Coriobacteriales bacterium]